MVCAPIPRVAAGDTMPLLLGGVTPTEYVFLIAAMSSLCADYALRQKSTRMNLFVVKQAPVPSPACLSSTNLLGRPVSDFVVPRVIELCVTSDDMRRMASDCGLGGGPFRWEPERRAAIQAELDALFFHLYGLDRRDTEWVLDSFTVLRKYEERPVEKGGVGEFRTKRLVLEYYDRMAEAIASGVPYDSPISPPPGDDSQRHGARART